MKKAEEQNISEVMQLFLKKYGLLDKYTERELYARWEELAGSAINNRTKNLRFNKGYLLVLLNSSTIRAELSMRKTELVEQINQRMKRRVVKEITFK